MFFINIGTFGVLLSFMRFMRCFKDDLYFFSTTHHYSLSFLASTLVTIYLLPLLSFHLPCSFTLALPTILHFLFLPSYHHFHLPPPSFATLPQNLASSLYSLSPTPPTSAPLATNLFIVIPDFNVLKI